MAKATVKGKKGKKPTPKHHDKIKNVAMKKAPESKGEVGGKTSPGAVYLCWNCGRASYVPYGWDYFICPYCGATNIV